MKHQWRIQRQFNPHQDGEQRWDRAYQYLLLWAKGIEPSSSTNSDEISEPTQEVDHANSSLCSGLYKKSS
jgi:hypothetical protein